MKTPAHVELDELVMRIQHGDDEAFSDLVVALANELKIFISCYASSATMVEEVLQATLVTCYQNIGKYEPRGTFVSWVKGIARNLVLKELRDRSRCLSVEDDVLERLVVERSVASAERPDDAEDLAQKLRDCMAGLTQLSRDLLDMKYVKRLSVDEIARLLKRSGSWVAVTLFRIRDKLRTCLAQGAATT